MARKYLEDAERYPNELAALRVAVRRLGEALDAGSLDWAQRVMAEERNLESAALAQLPWAPEEGKVYGIKDATGVRLRAVVLDSGLWVKRLAKGGELPLSAGSGAFSYVIRRSSTSPAREHHAPSRVGQTLGRLVLMTSGGRVMDHGEEIRALASFQLPEIPASVGGAESALRSVEAAGRTAGLVLGVRPTAQLVDLESPGE